MNTVALNCNNRPYFKIGIGIAVFFFIALFLSVNMAAASSPSATTTPPLSQAKIEKDIQKLTKEVARLSEKEKDVNLYGIQMYLDFDGYIFTAKDSNGEDLSDTINTFKKLDKKYADNNGKNLPSTN